MENQIGINQRIPMDILESAIKANLNGTYTRDYAQELARTEYDGENRIKKTAGIINRLTLNNNLNGIISEQKDAILSALNYSRDKAIILVSILNSAYPFAYNLTETLGKYFHAQNQVTSELIVQKMSSTYGSNRSLPNALYSVLPMMIEVGFLKRPKPGIYEMKKNSASSEIAALLYMESYFVNNPSVNRNVDVSDCAYFEFV